MSETSTFAINHSKIVFENFGDEVVLINLDNGNYFSIRETAGIVWKLIENGFSTSESAEVLRDLYEDIDSDPLQDVTKFINQLLEEGLLVTVESVSKVEEVAKDIEVKNPKYSAPELEVYSDMQDLILLDPIHEVDESGWPNVKNEDEQSASK